MAARLRAGPVAALLAVVALAGCGSGDDPAAQEPDGPPDVTADGSDATEGSEGSDATDDGPGPLGEGTAGAAVLDTEELLDLARPAVVRVRTTGCGDLGVGTAWFADDGRLLSNAHVIEWHRRVDVLSWDGHEAVASGVSVSASQDIGLLEGDWSPIPGIGALEVRGDRLEPGDPVTVVGYPEGDQLQASTGEVIGYEHDPRLSRGLVLRTTNPLRPGNSGGPALDRHGRVVGIVYATEIATDDALIIPSHVLENLSDYDIWPVKRCDTHGG